MLTIHHVKEIGFVTVDTVTRSGVCRMSCQFERSALLSLIEPECDACLAISKPD
jgi:hypothetical protein